MVKRHRFVTPLEDLSPEWITHTEYVLGDKFINFGFFDSYSLKYRERTLKFHGWKHKGLMRRGILPLTPTYHFSPNGQLITRFIEGLDFVKFKSGGYLQTVHSDHYLGEMYLNHFVKNWYKKNWNFIKSGDVEISIHFGMTDFDNHVVYSVEQVNNLLALAPTFAGFWNYKVAGQDKFVWFHFTGDYNNKRTYFYEYPLCKIVISKKVELHGKFHKQSFLSSKDLSHCFFQPILKWAESLLDAAKTARSHKRYIIIVNHVNRYIKKYAEGVPDSDLQEIADKLKLDFTVKLPLYQIDNLMEVKCKTKCLKHFKYMNVRFNHLEEVSTQQQEQVDVLTCNVSNEQELDTPKAMKSKLDDITSEGRLVALHLGYEDNSITQIQDCLKSITYLLKSEYRDAVSAFEEKHGLDNNWVHVTDGLAHKMICAGTHHNCTVDFNNPWCAQKPEEPDGLEEPDELDFDDSDEFEAAMAAWQEWLASIPKLDKSHIIHIDQKKSYFNSQKCPYYDGFLARWSDCRVCEVPIDDAIKTTGFYMIDDLDVSGSKFLTHVNKFNCYHNNKFYPHCEIKFMWEHLGLRFKIVAGVWGPRMELEFPETMKQKVITTTSKRSFYSIWTGSQSRWTPTKSYQFVKGTNVRLLQVMKAQMEKQELKARLWIDNGNKSPFATFTFPKKTSEMKHRSHLSAYIYAYARITTIMQALEVQPDHIIRVCVDGIYINNQGGQYGAIKLIGSFRHKDELNGEHAHVEMPQVALNNLYGDSFTNYKDAFVLPKSISHDYIKYHDVTYGKGPGGIGKTWEVLRDHGYRGKLCYAPHSNKLCAETWKEHGEFLKDRLPYQNITRQMVKDSDPRVIKQLLRCNHIVGDEVSFWTFRDIQRVIAFGQKHHIKITLLGDIGYQVPPCAKENKAVISIAERLKLFQQPGRTIWDMLMHIHKKTGVMNFRFKGDEKHCASVYHIRDMMDNKQTITTMLLYLKEQGYKFSNYLSMYDDILLQDFLICSEHVRIGEEHNKVLRKKFASQGTDKKYRFKKNCKIEGEEFNNGDVKEFSTPPAKSKADETYYLTIHSVQGMSVKSPHKLYIDINRLKQAEVLYTALSRAKTMEQVEFVGDIKPPTRTVLKPNPYHKAKLYKIYSKNCKDVVYFGSTYQSLKQRLRGHEDDFNKWKQNKDHPTWKKHKHIRSFDVMIHGDYHIELVEKYPCDKESELKRKEGELILQNRGVATNAIVPGGDPKVKAAAKSKQRAYEKKSKSKRVVCECGQEVSKRNLLRHKGSKSHQVNMFNTMYNKHWEMDITFKSEVPPLHRQEILKKLNKLGSGWKELVHHRCASLNSTETTEI